MSLRCCPVASVLMSVFCGRPGELSPAGCVGVGPCGNSQRTGPLEGQLGRPARGHAGPQVRAGHQRATAGPTAAARLPQPAHRQVDLFPSQFLCLFSLSIVQSINCLIVSIMTCAGCQYCGMCWVSVLCHVLGVSIVTCAGCQYCVMCWVSVL